MLTPDEEVGSPTSRAIIEREGAGAALALIPEPAGPGGVCVTARKGVGRFTLCASTASALTRAAPSGTALPRWSNSRTRYCGFTPWSMRREALR